MRQLDAVHCKRGVIPLIAVLGLLIALLVGIGYAALAYRVASSPRLWHWPLMAAYVLASLTVLIPDAGFILAGLVGLAGIGLNLRRAANRLVLLAAAALWVSPLLLFRFTTIPIPNVFASP